MGADGRYGAAQPLSPAAQPVKAVAAASNGSTAIVSWVRIDPASDGDGQVMAALRPALGAFGAPEAVSPSENASATAPGFTAAPAARPFVLWASRPGGEGPASRSPGSARSCGSPSARPDGRRRTLGRWTCSSASPPPACSRPTGRSSSCSRAGATRSACSTSPSRFVRTARCARCTSTTGCARRPTATRRTAQRVRGAGRGARGPPRRPPRRRAGQPAGVGARRPLRGRRGMAATAGPRRVAAAHTATDQAETILYRLAASPGRRALLGMPARSGRLVRPLLGVTREETAAWCRARGLAWREDATNGQTVTRAPACEAPSCRRSARSTRRPSATSSARPSCCATRPRCSTSWSTRPWPAATGSPSGTSRRCRARSRGSCAAPRRAGDRRAVRRAAGRLDEILALGDGALDLGAGARAVVDGGVLRCERTPPLPAHRT